MQGFLVFDTNRASGETPRRSDAWRASWKLPCTVVTTLGRRWCVSTSSYYIRSMIINRSIWNQVAGTMAIVRRRMVSLLSTFFDTFLDARDNMTQHSSIVRLWINWYKIERENLIATSTYSLTDDKICVKLIFNIS